jgi:hypothetical protein
MKPRTNPSDKKTGWCWQEKAVLNLLNDAYGSNLEKKRTARSIYLAFTQVCSNAGKNPFFATRTSLSGIAGVSPSTLERYKKDFKNLGILSFKLITHENLTTSVLWTLFWLSSIPIHNDDEGVVTIAAMGGIHNTDKIPLQNSDEQLKNLILEKPKEDAVKDDAYERLRETVSKIKSQK